MNKLITKDYLQQGELSEVLKQLQDQIRYHPANVEYRIFLFQLLCVQGKWERALKQLDVAAELDDSTLAMVSMYRQVIACEQSREAVFLGNKDPVIFGEPEQWHALLIEALKLTSQGKYQASQELRTDAFSTAAMTSGIINEQPFEWFADNDPRLGPMIEVIIEGRYIWVPVDKIKTIIIEEPVDLRDVVWLPAHLTWNNGEEHYGLIPSRYPFSYQHDSLLALSRKTQWHDCGEDLFLGMGQKIWSTQSNEYPVMDIRRIEFISDSNSDSNSDSVSDEGQ